MPFYVSGKISSLVDKNLTGNITTLAGGFWRLFSNEYASSNLFEARYLLLDFTDLSQLSTAYGVDNWGIYGAMFNECINLEVAPALPATNAGELCYYAMFGGCTKLRNAPALPATILEHGCYEGMFSGCSSLITPAVMPNTVTIGSIVDNNLFNYMYSYCKSLTYLPKLPLINITNPPETAQQYPALNIFGEYEYSPEWLTISTNQSQETPYVFRLPASGTQLYLTNSTRVNYNTWMNINTDYYSNIPMLQ